MESGIDAEGISVDPEVVKAYLADPLVEGRLTVSLAAEMFGAAERTGAGGADVALPLLALHGTEDPLCAASGSEMFAAAAPQGQYRAYRGMRHEIFNEPDRESVFEDVLAWMRALESDRGAGAGEPS